MTEQPKIILVCGGRGPIDALNQVLVRHVLSELHDASPLAMLIQGGAPGVDRVASLWAESVGVHHAEVQALWNRFGHSAGPRRNKAMLSLRPDLVLAFPGGRGTTSMVGLARKAGVAVREVRWESEASQ